MSWLDSLWNAVSSVFSAPKVQSSWPSAPTPSYSSSTPSYSSQISKQSYPSARVSTQPAISSGARGVSVQGPTYSMNQGGSNVPSNAGSSSVSAPPIQSTIKNISSQIASTPLAHLLAPEIGKAGKALTGSTESLWGAGGPQLVPGGIGAAAQGWAGTQNLINEAQRRGITSLLPQAFQQYSKAASELTPMDLGRYGMTKGGAPDYAQLGRSALNAVSGGYAGNWLQDIMNNLYQKLLASAGPPSVWQGLDRQNIAQTGLSTRNLPTGQITPRAASTASGTSRSAPSISPTATRASTSITPSQGTTSQLPANFSGLNQTNVNPAVSQAITPQAVQALGQMMLQSILTPQSSLTGITPGLAQALWGAPTAFSPFGGYTGLSSPTPSPSFVQQPKGIPPLPAPVSTG